MLLILNSQSGDPVEPEVPSLVIVAELSLTLETTILTIELDTVDA